MKNQEASKFIVGVDMHPDSFAGAAFAGNNIHECKKQWIHSRVSTSDWEKWLKRHIPIGSVIVMEASCNSFAFAESAESLGYKAVVLESYRIGQISRSYCKNDKEDATKIAKVYLSGLCLDSVWCPDQATRHNRELLSLYRKTVKDSTRSKNRLKSFLTGHKIRLKGNTARLTRIETEEYIKKTNKWTERQKLIIGLMCGDVRYYDEKRRNLQKLIISEVLASEIGRKLLTLCGIRAISAFAIISTIGDINRFRNPKKLVAYFGFSPKCHESGNSVRKGGMSKRGRKDVKSLLIQSAQAILRSRNKSGEKIRKWGFSLMFRKDKNVVVAAVARKLTVAIWYLMKGFIPKIMNIDNDIKKKLKKLAEELKLSGIKALGYDKVVDFIEEYSQILLLRT